VFGVSSDEFLTYATQNREEWKARGEEMVQEMMANIQVQQVRSEFRSEGPVRIEC
jgi:hypothetical protein